MKPIKPILIVLVSLLNGGGLFGQGSTMTYQGRLNDTEGPANGTYDLRFTLFASSSGGAAVAGPVTNSAVAVSNGLFAVALDFGANIFTGAERWLEIAARTNSGDAFTPLLPRQPVTATPYSIRAAVASSYAGPVAAAQLTGTISPANIASGSITAAMLASNAVSRLSAPDGSPTNAVQVNSNGLVGIGTTTPQAGLEIVSGSAFAAPEVLFQQQDETGGYTNLSGTIAVAAFGNLLAVAGWRDRGITLLDLSFNPRFPNIRSQFRDGDGSFTNLAGPRALAMKTNLLVVAAESDHAVTLISVTNPTSPVKLAELRDGVGGWNELLAPWSLAISGNLLAIAAHGDNAVTLADISNPSAPIKRSEMKDGVFGFTNLQGAASVALSGNLLAIASLDEHAVTLVDVSDPANPVKRAEMRYGVGGFDNLQDVYGVALSGNLLAIAAYAASAVTLVSVTNPANPVKMAEMRYGEGGVDTLLGTRSVALSGNWLAASGYEDSSVTLFDISNPSGPRLAAAMKNGVGGFNLLWQAWGLAFAGTNLAVTGYNESYGGITLAGLPTATASLISQNRVGIGTASPAAPLHVMGNVVVEDADLFDINARRVEFGFLTIASGLGSTAMGETSIASGATSTAMGYSTTASGDTSTAMGRGSIASGYTSTAIGAGTIASGDYSTAMGYTSIASGDYSLAAGRNARATNEGSFVWADSQSGTFGSTANNQFLIRAAGGMGVNVAQPRGKLHVGTSSNAAPISAASHTIIIDNAAENGRAAFLALAGPGGSTETNRVELQLEANEAQRVGIIGTTSDHEVQFRQNNVTQLRVATNGNIGIGIANPPYKLSVRDGNYQIAIVDSDNTNKTWNWTSIQGNSGMGFYEDESSARLVIEAGGNVGIGTINPTNKLHVAGGVSATAFVTTSDRNAKENFAPVSPGEVLAKVAALPITTWNFKELPKARHMGPMAQDFHAAFGLGSSDTTITTVDPDGVALAAIQGLNEKVEMGSERAEVRSQQSESRLQKLEAENAELKARLARLERLLDRENGEK